MLVYIFCCKGVIPSLWTCLTPCLFVANTVLQVGDRLVALENKIDETLTESISILKQVTLSLFNIRFTNFPEIKKPLNHFLSPLLIAIEHQYKKLYFLLTGLWAASCWGWSIGVQAQHRDDKLYKWSWDQTPGWFPWSAKTFSILETRLQVLWFLSTLKSRNNFLFLRLLLETTWILSGELCWRRWQRWERFEKRGI